MGYIYTPPQPVKFTFVGASAYTPSAGDSVPFAYTLVNYETNIDVAATLSITASQSIVQSVNMLYHPPSGGSVDLLFIGPQAPPLMPDGGNLILAFTLSSSIISTTVQGLQGNLLDSSSGITGAMISGQSQKLEGLGNASFWIHSIDAQTGQANQKTEMVAIYVPPTGANLIINLGAGAYSPPLGSNLIIDLGELSTSSTYTKYLMFLNDTMFF